MDHEFYTTHENPPLAAGLMCTLTVGFSVFGLLLMAGVPIVPAYFFASMFSAVGFILPVALAGLRKAMRGQPGMVPARRYPAQVLDRH